MKYQAHLKTGAIVDVELNGDLPNLFGGEYRALLMEWLVDDNGAMLNMAHVAALVPVLDNAAEAPSVPTVIVDDDGDKWTLGEDGKYRWKDARHGSIMTPETRDEIKEHWGIREEW
jgi:hypothetical protein